jgi:hypothetical protein
MIADLFQGIIDISILAFGLWIFVLLALATEVGFRIGLHRPARREGDGETSGVSTVTGGMLGLAAFMLALSINFAQDRFETRRHTTVDEANAIGTAWLRTGLAEAAGQPIAALIDDYAHVRLAYLQTRVPGEEAALLAQTAAMQTRIWQQTLPLLKGMSAPLAASLVASLNDVFDASLVQRYALESRVPLEALLMLLGGSILTVGALGYQMGLAGRRPLVLALLLLLMFSGGIMLLIDLSRARLGLTQIDPAPLIWTIQGFAPSPK